jgi:hypothetical protein
MRLNSMRICLSVLLVLVLGQTAQAAPADTLREAKAEIAAGRIYPGDDLLQQVVDSPDSNSAQVEEALLIQCLIYSGDVLGAAALIGPLASASPEGSGMKTLVSQQLLLARRAYSVAANSYLNTTIKGTSLSTFRLELPHLTTAEVTQLMTTLANKDVLSQMMQEFGDDPSAGHGLLAQVNIYSMYLACGSAFDLGENARVEHIGSATGGGIEEDQLQLLDWAARVALDMNTMVNEPNGPDLASLARRFDQRILAFAGDDATNQYVINARNRAKIYEP